MKIKKGDSVQITTGKDAGKIGDVLEVNPTQRRIKVEGVHIIKRHKRSQRTGDEKGIIERPAFIDASNALLVCPKCKLPTRVGFVKEEDKKLRQCKKCSKTFV